MDGADGDTTPAAITPSEAPETSAPEPTDAPEAPAADTGAEPTGEAEWRLDATEFDEVNPDLARYRKQLQADYTRKQQELSERQKAYEGVEADEADFLRQVKELQKTDKRAAAEMLRQAAQWVEGPPPPQPQEPEEEPEFATDVERQLWLKASALEERLAANDAWRQQEQQARYRAEIDRKFAHLEGEAGRPIPLEERHQIANWCMQNAKSGPNGELLLHEVDHAWKILNFDKVKQQARSEAAGSVERKAAITPGPSTITRNQPPPREAESLDEALRPVLSGQQ
ncbi:MAG: hypothetical protein H0X07_00205 [Gemmatimonadales bacterium]|nr:hypothetical protein [Gemmatimonadales bacterium]